MKSKGLSMRTALEIFTNPSDLLFSVGRDGTKLGKYGFAITRGPGGCYKLLVDSCGFAENAEGAIEHLKGVLESIQQATTKEFKNSKSIPSQYLNPEGLEIDQSKVLNSDLIGRILEELRRWQVARTYEMLATAG